MQSICRLLISKNSFPMNTRSKSKILSDFVHDEAAQKFCLKIDSVNEATVEYEKHGDILDLTDSFVPESLRGKGIGHVLAKNTFDYIHQENWKMKVTCTFLIKYFEANKNKYKHLLVD